MAAAAVLLVDSKPPTNNSRYPAASGVRSSASPATSSAAHVAAYQGDDLSMDSPSASSAAGVTSGSSADAASHSAPNQSHDSRTDTFPRLPERVSASANGGAGGACRRTFSVRPKRQPVLRHAAEVVYFPKTSYQQHHRSGDDSRKAPPSHRRTSSDFATGHSFDAAAAEAAAFSAIATAATAGHGAAADVAFRLRIAAGQSAPRRALTRSASFQPIDGSDSDSPSSGSPDAGDSFAFHVSVPGICAAAAASAASAGAVLSSPISSTAETGGADTRLLSSMGARSPSRSAAAAAAAAIAPAQTGASGRSGPRSPTPPTSQGVPRTPSLRLPPSPASSRRGIISSSSFHAPGACPLPPPSPSASPVSSPCLSPSAFSFAVPRADSRENRASAAVSGSVSRGGDGWSGSGMSSQWESSSRSLRAGRNLSVSSPNRMLSTNLNLKAAMACVAGESARGAAADSPRTGVAVSAAIPSPTRSATAGGILRRGGLKRMPSLDSMLPAYATSSSPSSSPLSIPTAANPHATVTPTEPLPGAASATASPSPGLSPVGSPIPTPQLSPGRSPKGKHVRRVSFCSMVRVRRFSACDADLGPAANAAITAFAEAEAAAAAERAAAAESAESAAAAAAAGAASQATAKTAKAAEEVRAAEENVQVGRVPPAAPHALQRGSQSFESTQKSAAQHALQRGSQSFTERPHRHSRSPSYSGSLHLVPEPAAQPRGIRRSSSFQSPGSGASPGQHSIYGRPRHQLAYHPSHYLSNHTAHLPSNLSPNYDSSQSSAGRSYGKEEERGGQQLPELGDVGVGSGSGEFELELRLPVPPKMPSPRLSPSPRVQRLLQQMWGDLNDGDDV